jgi:hypothetical protein
MNTRRSVCWILLASAVGVSAAACGSGGSSSAPKPSPSPHSASAAATPSASPSASATASSVAADEQEITANWTAFFNPKTSPAQKTALVQNGSQFASILKAQASNPQQATSSAKVLAVTVITSSEAQVTYDILLSGTPVLSNQKGTAVLQDGTWKVGIASFCGLLSLESSGKTSSLPAACKSAT